MRHRRVTTSTLKHVVTRQGDRGYVGRAVTDGHATVHVVVTHAVKHA